MSNAVFPSGIRGLAYTVTKTAEFSTDLQSSSSKNEVRVPLQSNPIWTFQLIYEVIKDRGQLSPFAYSEYRALQGFYLARQGKFDDFLFDDVTDDTVGIASWKPNTLYLPGSFIVDAAGHQQSATVWGTSGSTLPSFNEFGGTTADGSQLWQDDGLIDGALGQSLQLLNDGAGNYYSPLQSNFGGQFLQNVTDLNLNQPITMCVNGLTDPPPTLSYNILGPGFVINGVTYGLVFSWGWQPGSPYPTGSIIIDPAGHLQLQTAPFGYSSGFLPAFSDSGGSVTDNALIWTDQGLATTVFGSFSFYYRVRFATDRQDFEQFTKDFWTIGGSQGKNSSQLTLVTARPIGS